VSGGVQTRWELMIPRLLSVVDEGVGIQCCGFVRQPGVMGQENVLRPSNDDTLSPAACIVRLVLPFYLIF
jgi:hypothetical protein